MPATSLLPSYPPSTFRFYPHLVPERIETNVLSSFEQIRSKTIETLYGSTGYDRSPKGSVDDAVLALVNLINDHPSYATLSSCSGRIALYDPELKSDTSNSRDGNSTSVNYQGQNATTQLDQRTASTSTTVDGHTNNASSSGKGGSGGWLLVSHETIDPQRIVEICCDDNVELSPAVMFKFEPMLLHVAAASLEKGKELLQSVLQLGFRESGLIVTETRVTVAIRTFGLSMSIPIGPVLQHLSKDPQAAQILQEWAREANQRLEINLKRLDRLFAHLQEVLFRPADLKYQLISPSDTPSMPDLNLWGHASVSLPSDEDSVDILVFGGYGRGPISSNTGSQRSDKVWRLRRRMHVWECQWEQVYPTTTAGTTTTTEMEQAPQMSFFGVVGQKATFTAREGAKACVITLPGAEPRRVPFLFGGRTNPAHALDDLLLFDFETSTFLIPFDIRGKRPCPRWGHTMTSLLPSTRAVVFGGRDATSVFDDIYILSMVQDSNGFTHCFWESVSMELGPLLPPRFHHATIACDARLFIFGGLSNHQDLLEPFSMDSTRHHAYTVDLSTGSAQIIDLPVALCRFGHTMTLVHHDSKSVLGCCLGGVSACIRSEDASEEPIMVLFDISRKDKSWKINVKSVPIYSSSSTKPWGPLVHHSSHLIQSVPATLTSSASIEMLSVGGGVSGFAFGDFFAASHFLCVVSSLENEEDPGAVVDLNATTSQKALGTTSQDTPGAAATSVAATTTANGLVVPVFYVHKSHAKTLKNELETRNWLNKYFRMTRATAEHLDDFIAVPVTKQCLEQCNLQLQRPGTENSWMLMIHGLGEQQMLYRSSYFAASARKE